MNTFALLERLKNFKNFVGVYPKDKIPRLINKSEFGLIINTHPASLPGEHWLAIYCKNGHGEFYDSFGRAPQHKEILKFLKRNCKHGFTYNKVKFQSYISSTCGLHCVLYLACRFKNVSVEEFRKLFCKKPLINDLLITFLA